MNNEYRIFNATPIQKRIEELKESLATSEAHNDKIRAGIETFEIKQLEWCLSQSTPLIPEIEKAFDLGFSTPESCYKEDKQDYISNLKLDI
jgi:hypothetical protein